jgi:hypothetical protein
MPSTDNLQPCEYYIEFGGYRFTFRVAEAGWSAKVGAGGMFHGDDSELAIFWPGGTINSLFEDPCHSLGTAFDPGPMVDDLVAGLLSLDGFEAGEPFDVTVAGYSGKRLAITVPMDVDVRSSECDDGRYSLSGDRWFQAPGQTDDIRILDLGGTRQVVIASTTPATPRDVVARLDSLVASLVIEPI